jgi:uncharacterized Fe-S center protein
MIYFSPAWSGKNEVDGKDKFRAVHTDAGWRPQIDYGEKMGIGTGEYRIIKI